MDLHGAFWTEFLAAEALYALAPIDAWNLRTCRASGLCRYHGDGLCGAGLVAFSAADALILFNDWLGVENGFNKNGFNCV